MKQAFRGFVLGAISGGVACAWGFNKLKKYDVGDDETQKISENSQVRRILKHGIPEKSPDLYSYKNHVLRYDQERRIPRWVAERISTNNVQGAANRKYSKFKPDEAVPVMFTSQNDDFWNSGWSRGHMAPAGNYKHDQEAMNDTFLLTNVVPQDISNNAGFWNRLELFCRDLTKQFEEVSIFSGPLFVPHVVEVDDKKKKFVKYEVSGKSEVAVPTHLFKVIVVEDKNTKNPLVAAFVIPNRPIPNEHQLLDYQVPLEYIESRLGEVLLPEIKSSGSTDLCKSINCQIIAWDKFELFFIQRKLEGANTVHRLEKVWKEMENKGIQPDEKSWEIYKRKSVEIQNKGTVSENTVSENKATVSENGDD